MMSPAVNWLNIVWYRQKNMIVCLIYCFYNELMTELIRTLYINSLPVSILIQYFCYCRARLLGLTLFSYVLPSSTTSKLECINAQNFKFITSPPQSICFPFTVTLAELHCMFQQSAYIKSAGGIFLGIRYDLQIW